ncbi:hypothetical protein CCACVL1_08034 [Corchorus capsularis]|uniref:Transposase (Putative), gypsy type n=1 Tax=Corchorus capsularis TaxID=210143 RepID=A0A1R3J2Q6_COCAP|nr:hypothetical protein CCACVL1_08034 [Corchorus capsularis]
MSQSGSSEQTPEAAIAMGVSTTRGRPALGQALAGNNDEVGEISAAGAVSTQGERISGSDESASSPEEPVRLDFGSRPNILEEQLGVYHSYCGAKFILVGATASEFRADGGNEAAYQYYVCASEAGLCSGENGFKAVNCGSDDRAFSLRKGGRLAFFYQKAFEYGFRLPAHPFIAELCDYYGGWTPHVSVIRHLFQLQRRNGGWYAFQVRRGYKNKFPGPENNQKWHPKFFGVEALNGTEWGTSVQWWEINTTERNGSKGWVLSAEEEHVDYLERVRHSPEELCHRTRLYLCGLAPVPDAYEQMPALELGTSVPTPGAVVPKASPGLIEEELDPERQMVSKDELRAQIQEGMALRGQGGTTNKGKGRGRGRKRLAEDLPPRGPKGSVAKKPRSGAHAQASDSAVKGASSSSVPVADKEGASVAAIPRSTPSVSGDRELASRVGLKGKHEAVPPREKSKGNLDFLCTLMTRSLKLGEPGEIETVETISDDECAAVIVACSRQLSIYFQRMLRPYRSSLLKKDKNLIELMDENLPVYSKKEFKSLQESVEKFKRAKEDIEKQRGLMERKVGDLQEKFSQLEKANANLTSEFAAMKRAKDEDAATHALFRAQAEIDIAELKTALENKTTALKDCEEAKAGLLANAIEIASDLSKEAKKGLLKSIQEAHPEWDLSAFEPVEVVEEDEEVEDEEEEEAGSSPVADTVGDTSAARPPNEVVPFPLVIPSSKLVFTTDDLFDGIQGVDMAQSKAIAEKVFGVEEASNADVGEPSVTANVEGEEPSSKTDAKGLPDAA